MLYKKIPLDANDQNAFLEVYVADEVSDLKRKAILIIPGGAYHGISKRESEPVALAFMPHCYNAFILHYSVGENAFFPKQLIQASKAMKHIKDNAKEYNIDPENVFAVGFSAGGHLAGSLGILWNHDKIYEELDMEYGYNKPKGVMLMYPVITGVEEDICPKGSFKNLLGENASYEARLECSLEKHVNENSSPAFIMHTANDASVLVKNSLYLAEAYSDKGVPFELHVYPKGRHGISLANEITAVGDETRIDEGVAKWVENAVYWADKL